MMMMIIVHSFSLIDKRRNVNWIELGKLFMSVSTISKTMTDSRIRDRCITDLWMYGASALNRFPCNEFCKNNSGTCVANVITREKAPCKGNCNCVRQTVLTDYAIGEQQTPSESDAMKRAVMRGLDASCPGKEAGVETMYSGSRGGSNLVLIALAGVAALMVYRGRGQ
jgi:hypothetical protein